MDYQKIIEEIALELESIPHEGEVASYIPELAKINPNKFALNAHTIEGQDYNFGDVDERFSIQSISKVFMLTQAYMIHGPKLWERVGVEPSGNPFNSLVQLEYENGIPRNPFINAGALVIADILCDTLENPKEDMLNFVRRLSGNNTINFNEKVARSEKETGFKNAAQINLMKSFGNIKNDINCVLDFYYHMCSIEMSVKELSRAFMLYVNHGVLMPENIRLMKYSKSKRMNALMQTCGFYDEAGQFSFKVGLPGKSGVGGGIVAIHPEKYAVAVWSPRLNKKGNSFLGMKALEMLTTKTSLSIF